MSTRSFRFRPWRQFAQDQEGSILLLFAIGLVVLAGVAGAGIDLGRAELKRARLQQAADAGAVAGASMTADMSYYTTAQVEASRASVAKRYFDANYQVAEDEKAPTVNISAGGGTVTIDATDNVSTGFVSLFGISKMDIAAHSVVSTSVTTTATKYDVMLVMDSSGSMCADATTSTTGTPTKQWDCNTDISKWRMTALKAAASTLVDTYLPAGNNGDNRVAALSWNYGTLADPTTNTPDDPRALSGSIGFTSDPVLIKNFLNSMVTKLQGEVKDNSYPATKRHFPGTNSWIGMSQALSLGGANPPDGFRTSGVVKVIIILTDGINNCTSKNIGGTVTRICDPNSQGVDAAGDANQATYDGALAFKNNNSNSTLVYTIGFGKDVQTNTTIQNTIAGWASGVLGQNQGQAGSPGPQYSFIAPTELDLQNAFNSIATSVKKIRISQ